MTTTAEMFVWGETEDSAPKMMEDILHQLEIESSAYERKKLFNIAHALWTTFKSVQNLWDYVSEARLYLKRFVRKVKAVVVPSSCVEWNGIQPMADGIQQVYLIRLLDADNQLIWSKVGTTTRKTTKRMNEHLRYYRKDGACKIEVLRLWDCGSMDAEGLESEFRAHYIKKHPNTFRKNDRFINVEFDLDEADHIVQEYLKG